MHLRYDKPNSLTTTTRKPFNAARHTIVHTVVVLRSTMILLRPPPLQSLCKAKPPNNVVAAFRVVRMLTSFVSMPKNSMFVASSSTSSFAPIERHGHRKRHLPIPLYRAITAVTRNVALLLDKKKTVVAVVGVHAVITIRRGDCSAKRNGRGRPSHTLSFTHLQLDRSYFSSYTLRSDVSNGNVAKHCLLY